KYKSEMLKEIVKTKGIIIDVFSIASGKKSHYYYDIKQAILTPKSLALSGELGLELLKGLDAKSVGGLESGAIPFATAISLSSIKSRKPLQMYFVRKQARAHGRRKWIEGNSNSPAVVVDDVITTGNSSAVAIDRLIEAGCNVAGVIALVDREEGAK